MQNFRSKKHAVREYSNRNVTQIYCYRYQRLQRQRPTGNHK